MKHILPGLPWLLPVWLLFANRAAGTSLTITITNLPPSGSTAEGRSVALAGTLNGWNNNSTLATVTQGRLVYTFPDIGPLSPLGSEWSDKPDGANAAFQFVAPGSWSERAVKADFNSNDGNFRVALVGGAANTVVIDAGPAPTLVDQASAVRVNGAVEREVPALDPARFAFPGGRWKALVMSYDDGHVQDRGLVGIFNAHGIRGTFHLNSGSLNSDTFVSTAEIPSLYAGHEVSSHTVHHPYLDGLDDGGVQWEVGTDRAALGAAAGYTIRSLSYPFGAFNNRVISLLANLGVKSARTTLDSYALEYFPPNPLKWHPTCHHSAAQGLADAFAARAEERMALLFVWGHSYELDYNQSNNSWAYMDALCAALGDRGDVWYATMSEVENYLTAARALEWPASHRVRNPSVSVTVWTRLAGRLSKVRPGANLTYPAGSVRIAPDDAAENTTITLRYVPGTNAFREAAAHQVHIGRDGWQEVHDLVMTREGDSAWTCSVAVPDGARRLDFAFTDGQGLWDDNGGGDWALTIRSASPAAPAPVQCAPGSPAIATRSATGQNSAGESFDLDLSGGALATSPTAGFGSFGNVYVNTDATNLYLGATGCHLAGDNNGMILFLAAGSLAGGVANLWNLRGAPAGLDRLHNLGLVPAANMAIVLGDEYGDGIFPHFNLGNSCDFGQGVFYLSSGATMFQPVPGARLSQFDGAGAVPTGSSDDDANRQTDRWEVAIPWASLNAALGAASLGSLHVSGVIASDSVSGNDRYLSAHFLGEAAEGELDEYGNYGFHFVTLTGRRVGLPGADSDLDGMSDLHETLAGTDAGDPASALVMRRPMPRDGAWDLQFESVPGRQYRVQYRTDLAPGGAWLDLPGPLTATGGVCGATDPAAGLARVYYRVRLVGP